MKKQLLYAIRKSRLVKSFLKAPMPGWIVLACDILITMFAAFITFKCSIPPTPAVSLPITLAGKVACVTAIFALAMLVFKPYKAIVRLSAIEDTYRIICTVASVGALLIAFEFIMRTYYNNVVLGYWNIFTLCLIAFALMVTIRLFIKFVFRVASTGQEPRRRVIVLGSAINSYVLASALKNEIYGRFEPVLLLSQGNIQNETSAGPLPIRPYDPDKIGEIFEEFKCDTLLFLSTQMEFIRQEAGDIFLRNGIHLLMFNQVEEFNFDKENNEPMLSPHVQNIKIENLLGRDPIVTDKTQIKESIYGSTVMITGAAGSIGSEIVRQVASFGAGRVVLVDQAETPMHEMQLEVAKAYPDVKFELCIADVANRARMEKIFDEFRPVIVYHAAAYKHVPMMERNPSEAAMTNIFGTKILTDLSLKYKVEKFVMISTDKAVNPTNVMGATKRVAEIYVQSLANHLRNTVDGNFTKFITTRFGNVLGSNGSVIPLFRKQIEAGGPVTITHRDIIRYFMTIPEACSLVLEAACMGHGGEIFIFDMGQPVRIYDLAKRMISLAGMRPGIDIQISEIGLRPGEKLYEELLNNRELTMATHHKKIMIAKVRVYDYTEVCRHLDNLQNAVHDVNPHDVVAEIKRIVPEYHSENSIWCSVDKEIPADDHIEEIIDK